MKHYNGLSGFYERTFLMINNDLLMALDDLILASVLSKIINVSTSPAIEEYQKSHNGYFFMTIERLQRELCLGEAQQRSAIKKLEGLGLISTTIIGIPPKRHFKVNEDFLCRFVNSYLDSHSSDEIDAELIAANKEEFYSNLTTSIYEGFDAYKKCIDNMDKKFALPLYIYSRALYEYHGIKIKWDGAFYGKFKNVAKAHIDNFDYRRFLDILNSNEFETTKDHFWVLKELNRSTPELSNSKKVLDPQLLPEWGILKDSII